MQLGADGAAEDVGGEEVEGFGGEGLGGAAEVRALGGVDAGEADGDLRKGVSTSCQGAARVLDARRCLECHTVWFLRAALVLGIRRSQPHPASLPPGVW